MTGGLARRVTSVLLATLLAVAGGTLAPGAAHAADPKPCVGAENATCVPSNSTSDNAYPASGTVSASGERPNPHGGGTVLVTVTLPDPGVPVCSHGFGGAIVNAPCYENQFAYSKWNHEWGEFENTVGYTEVNGTRLDAALNAADYRLFLLRETVQIHRPDGPTVSQTIYGTYDRRSGAPAAAPSASFTYDVASDGTIEFHATSTDPYDRTMTHQWAFGDGTTSGGADPTHRYADSGSFMPRLTTTNSVNLSDSYSRLVIASGHPLEITDLSLEPSSPVPLDEPVEAHVTVRNNGTRPVTGIAPTVELTPTDKVRQGSGTLAPFDLAAGASHSFDVPVETLGAGEATIRVRTPGTVQGSSTTAVAALAFDIGDAEYAVTWSTDPARPRPGEPFDLTAHVTNNTGDDLHDVVPTLTMDPASGTTVSDPDPASIDSLPHGDAADVTWSVTSSRKALDATLDLSGKNSSDDTVTGSATTSLALHDLEVNETGDQAVDGDALADDRCDVDADDAHDNCTLRAAIQVANRRTGSSAISFDLPGAGVPRISPRSPLPATTRAVTIDGRTQGAGLVELHGSGTGTGLDVGGSGSTLTGLVVNGFEVGVRLGGDGDHRLLGNRIGTNTAGSAAAPNQSGVLVASHGDRIGGTAGTSSSSCTGDCNLVAGNSVAQVTNNLGLDPEHPQQTSGPIDVTVQGNWVGVGAAGRTLSGGTGIELRARQPVDVPAGTSVVIGGETARAGTAPGNLIATSGAGVLLEVDAAVGAGASTAHVSIAGNSVGLDPSGARSSGSRADLGIAVGNAAIPVSRVVVGGVTATAGNVVGGSETAVAVAVAEVRHNRLGTNVTGTRAVPNKLGLEMSNGGGAWDNLVSGNETGASGPLVSLGQGNVLGLAADGRTALPNDVGVRVLSTASIGADEFLGPALDCAGPCNVISGNTGAGILMDNDGGVPAIRVVGTYIGTDSSGSTAVPNGVGISVRTPSTGGGAFPALDVGGASAAGTGTCTAPCNVIAGNADGGVAFTALPGPNQEATTPNLVQGNFIGVGADGHPLPNGGAQVRMAGTSDGSLLLGGDSRHANLIASDGPAVAQIGSDARITVRSDRFVMRSTDEIVSRTGGLDRPQLRQAIADESVVHVTGTTFATLDPLASPDEVELYGGTGCDVGTWDPIMTGNPSMLTGDFALDVPATALAGFTHLRVVRTSDRATSRFSACLPLGQHTSTAQATPAGTTRMQVASNDGFAPGDYVTVDPGEAGEETARVVALGSLILAAPLRHSHAAGAVVEKVEPRAGDRTAPTATVKRPAARASYEQGQKVTGSVRCTDKGVGVALCGHPRLVDTTRLGKHTFVVTAVDRNGNTRKVTVAYSVKARKINLRARDTTPEVGHQARLGASLPPAVHGRFRIEVKDVGSGRVLKTCPKARSCAVWTPRRKGAATYLAVLRSTARGHRVLARSMTVLVRWS